MLCCGRSDLYGIIDNVKSQGPAYFGHIMRGEMLEKSVIL